MVIIVAYFVGVATPIAVMWAIPPVIPLLFIWVAGGFDRIKWP